MVVEMFPGRLMTKLLPTRFTACPAGIASTGHVPKVTCFRGLCTASGGSAPGAHGVGTGSPGARPTLAPDPRTSVDRCSQPGCFACSTSCTRFVRPTAAERTPP